jgi:hypothetical protein
MRTRAEVRGRLLRALGAALTGLLLAIALVSAQDAAAEGITWQGAYDGHLHGSDAFTSIEATAGGVYAAGYTAASWANRSDILLVRYASDGRRSWVRSWNGPASGGDQCWALARDRRGGLCLVGSTAGRGGDAAILRYSQSGRLEWSRRFDTGVEWKDDARFVRKLVGSDAVYVVIKSSADTVIRTSVARFSLTGERVWVHRFPQGMGVTGIVTDARDNVYLSGWSESPAGSEAVLSSLAPDGSIRWTTLLPGSAAVTRATSIADLGDAICWTTTSADAPGTLGYSHVQTSRYATFGELWETGPGVAAPNELNSVAHTHPGGIVAVGRLRGSQGDQGFALVADASGSAAPPLVWSDVAGCSGDLIAPAINGSSWIAGRTGYTFSVLHLVPASGLAWRYDYTDRVSGRSLALSSSPDGGVYVAGWGRRMGAAADAVILRVSP